MTDHPARFVTIFETRDPVALEAVEDYLRAHGLQPRGLGTRNASLIGAGQHIFGLRIEVPAESEAEARAALAAMQGGIDGVAPEELPDELRASDEDAAPRPEAPKTWMRAAASTFILPGGAHWYAGRPWTGLVVALGEIAGIATLLTSDWPRFMVGVLLLGGMLAFDLVGGLRAARRYNAGVRPGAGRQVAHGVLALGAVVAGALLLGPRIARPPDRYGYEREAIWHEPPLLHRWEPGDDGVEQLMLALDADPPLPTVAAEGYWYAGAAKLQLTAITLFTPNGDVPLGVISTTGDRALGTTSLDFRPRPDGRVNRPFETLTGGDVFCFEGFVTPSLQELERSLVVLVQLSADRRDLTFGVDRRPDCGAPPFSLPGDAQPYHR